MKVTIWQRFNPIRESEVLERYTACIDRTLVSQKIRPDLDYRMYVNFYTDAPTKVLEDLSKQLKRLVENKIPYTLEPAVGAGNAWFTTLTSYVPRTIVTKDKVVNVLLDGDQQYIDQILSAIDPLSQDLVERELLLGLGARNKVELAQNLRQDNMRKIEEMFHAKFMSNITARNVNNLDLSQVPPSYLKYKDPIPGFYALNTSHPEFRKFLQMIEENSILRKADLSKYAGDPFGVMCASLLVKEVPSVYAPIVSNPPGGFDLETIRKKSAELGKTTIGKRYQKIVASEDFQKELSGWYPEEDVNEVRNMILKGLENGMHINLT
jgi:hypothetical protein